MQYTHLGRSGLKVSRLCLGTMNFGPQTEEAAAHSIMDSALDSGINFFDTANVYGGIGHRGWTEEIIGRWFAKGGERRERDGPGHQALRHHDGPAQRVQAVRAEHPARPGRQPEAAADRLHRRLPVPPRRPEHAVGRDLAGHRGSRPAGQDPLLRQQQLRRLAHRPGPGGGRAPQLHRPGQRAVHLQPAHPQRRAGGHPGRTAVRPGPDPVVAAARRPAGRRAARRSATASGAPRAGRPRR